MKIIGISSSNRKNGNTERLIRYIGEHLSKSASDKGVSLELEYLSLRELNISVCAGCRSCFDRGEDKCPLRDDLPMVWNKLLEADGIILGSPVYVEDVNSIMKNMLDRMAFYCHRPAFFEKTALIVTTSGAGSSKRSLHTMKNALNSWGFYISAQCRFRMGGFMKTDEMIQKYDETTNKLADRFLRSLIKSKPLKPTFNSYLIFKMQQKYWQKNVHKSNEYDYIYWENKGWLKPDCNFYTKHKSQPVKSRIARALGGVLALFYI
jgi:multimeric flavodoxin WrbA